MKRLATLLACFFVLHLDAQQTLKLIRTILLPNVSGRIDHLAVDIQKHRIFVAALGNNTVEIVDYGAGKWLRSIGGCSEPQGVAFVPKSNLLFVANGGSGEVKILDAENFHLLKTVGSLPDADNARYDTNSGKVYIGFGDGGLAVFDGGNGNQIGTIPLKGHPESFQIESNTVFVNVPEQRTIAVVDIARQSVVTNWPLKSPRANFPMALDAVNHRLFIGCRSPARLAILETATGKLLTQIKIPADPDDVFYDAARKRIYVSCGDGFVDVIAKSSADNYSELGKIPTARGARTSFYIPEQNLLCVAVPRRGNQPAEIRIFKAE
jgi:DNA-binding beta-propeller fold protein YncE